MNDFDKAVKFIQTHDRAIVVFNKDAEELYTRIRKKYGGAITNYPNVIAFRFIFNEYAGYTVCPADCYDISDGYGYYEGQWYSVLSFDKHLTAKVV